MEAKGSIDFVKNMLFSEVGKARYDTFCIDKNKWETFETSFRFEKKSGGL
ncbi:hypothetical protein [Pseudobutyrivibrio sp. LB2011]|nr:hypothetical protein [Pseudobutyrivibrio sp. LB2011]